MSPYKDKALQKQTTKERVRRYRNKQKGVTMRSLGVTPKRTDVLLGKSKEGGEIWVGVEREAKLLLICKSLDKEIHGLTGRVSMLEMVRFGGLSMRGIKASLS